MPARTAIATIRCQVRPGNDSRATQIAGGFAIAIIRFFIRGKTISNSADAKSCPRWQGRTSHLPPQRPLITHSHRCGISPKPSWPRALRPSQTSTRFATAMKAQTARRVSLAALTGLVTGNHCGALLTPIRKTGPGAFAPGPGKMRQSAGYPPSGVNASSTWSRLKLAAFCRGGNSLKVCRNCPT